MPAVPNVPSVPRRQVAHILSRLHRESSLYIKDIAEEADLHHTTVSKMLKGQPCKLKQIYIDKLCDIYRASDEVRRSLKMLAVEAESAHGWWHTLTGLEYAGQLSAYITLEATATKIALYQNARIPGMLQAAEYTRALLRTDPSLIADEIERNVEIRLGRQADLINSETAVDIILDETVLRSLTAPEVAVPQLRRILDISKQANFRIRLVPFGIGIYCGTEAGPFTILEPARFGDLEPESPVVYVEAGVSGALYVDKPESVGAYRKSWAEIEKDALSVHKTRARLTEILEEVPGERT